MPHPLIGKQAPPLTLPSTPDGTPYTLPIGQKPIAIFFFPKAFTTGCTKEACAFRDAKKDNIVFQGTGSDELEVVGISRDAVEKQTRFADQHKLGYRILSDADGSARKSYSVSKAAMGLIDGRETFFIGKDGIVKDVCDKMIDWNSHTQMVEKQLKLAATPTVTSTAPAPAVST
ncbi:hypothetical protein QFC22_004912 [Naganishia vaughanmartiniae]|uniref:Uncharacterized protein n=1 Tax=Naganishia vaughanmartiniae TaxID=1424756 RepID=A0ACC2WXG0_9TREE|nr:hypothetical protein QFC22_004912 [Naganishia vaughanmartiniae]